MLNEESSKDKRAPSGFLGMRGKKPSSSSSASFPVAATYPEEVLYKRAPSGFLGMRGKKGELEEGDNYGKERTCVCACRLSK